MKKILALLLAVVMVCSLTACINKENAAKKLVIEELNVIKTADIDAMMEFIRDSEDLGGFDKETLAALCEGLFEYFDYEILSVTENEDSTFTVKTNIKSRNMENVVAKFYEKLMAYAFSMIASSMAETKSEEEIAKDTIDIMTKAFDEVEVVMTETEVDIIVKEENGEMVTEANDELFNAASGNFAELLGEMVG